jgi:LAO/AO transport system kinase
MVVEVPGMGDDVQAIKAGILEIADIFVVNKADREGADATIRQLRAMLHLGGPPSSGWAPPIVPAVAMRDEGIGQVAAEVERHLAHLHTSGQKLDRERARVAREFELIVRETALERVRTRMAGESWETLVTRMAARELDPYTAASELLG